MRLPRLAAPQRRVWMAGAAPGRTGTRAIHGASRGRPRRCGAHHTLMVRVLERPPFAIGPLGPSRAGRHRSRALVTGRPGTTPLVRPRPQPPSSFDGASSATAGACPRESDAAITVVSARGSAVTPRAPVSRAPSVEAPATSRSLTTSPVRACTTVTCCAPAALSVRAIIRFVEPSRAARAGLPARRSTSTGAARCADRALTSVSAAGTSTISRSASSRTHVADDIRGTSVTMGRSQVRLPRAALLDVPCAVPAV